MEHPQRTDAHWSTRGLLVQYLKRLLKWEAWDNVAMGSDKSNERQAVQGLVTNTNTLKLSGVLPKVNDQSQKG